MPIIELAMMIQAPRDVVYSISQDFSVRSEWDAFAVDLEMADGTPYLPWPGRRIRVRSKPGIDMEMELVKVEAPACITMKMVAGPSYLRKFAGSWSFEDVGERAVLVRFRYLLAIRRGGLRKFAEFFAIWYFRRAVLRRLMGLKRYCERISKLNAVPGPLKNFTF
ncbi:MAG TPA: SRPBCC family protein [Paucimonas sp.]|nr:SRPBCC family protein [Paucimonas sp.]